MVRKPKSRFIVYFLLAVMCVVSLVPFWMMISMSTYKSELIFKNNPLIPSDYL